MGMQVEGVSTGPNLNAVKGTSEDPDAAYAGAVAGARANILDPLFGAPSCYHPDTQNGKERKNPYLSDSYAAYGVVLLSQPDKVANHERPRENEPVQGVNIPAAGDAPVESKEIKIAPTRVDLNQ